MPQTTLATKRASIGVLALACLLSAVGIWLFAEDPETSGWLAGLSRVGLVLGALWLALPARGESVAWNKAAPILAVGLLIAALTRRMFPYVLPLALAVGVAFLVLRPKTKPGRGR